MTVTLEKPVAVGPNTVLLRWSSDLTNPIFRIACDGKELLRTRRTSAVFAVPRVAACVVQVSDSSAEMIEKAVPARAQLSFASVSDAEKYRIEQNDGGWTTIGERVNDSSDTTQRVKTPELDDGTANQFRVTAIDAAGNESSAASTTINMVRHPDPPRLSVSAEYNGGVNTTLVTFTEIS